MKTHNKYIYEKNSENTITLLRIYGESPVISVPSMVDGYEVTEIGPYCFSAVNKLSDDKKIQGTNEIAGAFLERIILPDTVNKIGDYAFYNCRNLVELVIDEGLTQIGSDVFKNCFKLTRINVRCGINDMPCLKPILTQISWNLEVEFEDAYLFYPEYSEGYDEIGPAHIFKLNISGEGFRMRQCFSNNRFSFAEYDEIFIQAQAEEPLVNLLKVAGYRLMQPTELSDLSKQKYVEYLKVNDKMIIKYLPKLREELTGCLIREGCLSADCVSALISEASEKGLAEFAVKLMDWKSKYITTRNNKYDFEDF